LAVVLQRNVLVGATGLLTPESVVAVLLRPIFEVPAAVITVAANIAGWEWSPLRVLEDSVRPATTLEIGTTFSGSHLAVSGSGSGIGVVTTTPTIVLESHIPVGLASTLTFVHIISIPLRTEFEVTLTIILVTANVVLRWSSLTGLYLDFTESEDLGVTRNAHSHIAPLEAVTRNSNTSTLRHLKRA
jgi:hypothetical protein